MNTFAFATMLLLINLFLEYIWMNYDVEAHSNLLFFLFFLLFLSIIMRHPSVWIIINGNSLCAMYTEKKECERESVTLAQSPCTNTCIEYIHTHDQQRATTGNGHMKWNLNKGSNLIQHIVHRWWLERKKPISMFGWLFNEWPRNQFDWKCVRRQQPNHLDYSD